MKERIVIETIHKQELKELAKEQGLTLSQYLVLKGLNRLKEKENNRS